MLTRVVHAPVEMVLFRIPDKVLHVVVLFLTIVIAADYALSFKAAMDIRDILVRLEKAREEIAHMQRRLDVIIAVAEDEMQQRKDAIAESVEETKEAIVEKAESVVERVEDVFERLRRIPEEYLENVKEEIAELSEKYKVVSESRKRIATIRDKYKRHILTNNPITSVHFKDALEELKERLEKKRQ